MWVCECLCIEIEINGAALLNHNHIELDGRRVRRSYGKFDGQMDILSLSSHFQEATEICLISFFYFGFCLSNGDETGFTYLNF